jgi:hypothetical protein
MKSPGRGMPGNIYINLRDRDGRLCCTGQDCRPVQATVLPNGSYYLPQTNEIIPADMATPSPDDHFHHCTYYPVGNEFTWQRDLARAENREIAGVLERGLVS